MKALPALLAACILLTAGCAGSAEPSATPRSPNSPAGTDVGTSNPGVNQPTTTTQTGRANSAADDIPNSRR